MIIKKIAYVMFLFFLFGCSVQQDEPEQKIENGVYHYNEYNGKKGTRGWGKRFWQLEIRENKGILSYFENGRGLNNFHLALDISVKENKFNVKYDSIISTAHLPPKQINQLTKGDFLFNYSFIEDSLVSNSDFFTITDKKNKLVIFNRTTDTIEFEPNILLHLDTSHRAIIRKYLGRGVKKKILVVPCYNGYEYAQHGYDFNPFIEKKLKEDSSINFIPFPYKKIYGSGYQSVYDKKYCNKIIEKTDADFLVMTKFTGNLLNFYEKDKVWGYETKILNVETMEQQVSIKANNLNSYEEIETDIETNIRQLVLDLN